MSLDDALEWSLGGRYTLHGEIAAGGMATVHIGRQRGTAGFSKMVAIKRLHAQYAKDPDFVSMFLDEARLAARVHHPNVVSTLDIIATDGEVFIVMEYIRGESLSKLLRALVPRGERMPLKVAAAVMVGVLHGLHAAHEATDEKGAKLDLVHRDVSPQNVLVGTDGIARVLDFGIAKAETRSYHTRDGDLKGKLAYMAPEQLTGEIVVDRRTDIYAASIVLWEVLTGKRLFDNDYQSAVLARIKSPVIEPPSNYVPELSKALDALVLKGLARDPEQRFSTAREMAIQLEMVMALATPSKVGEMVEDVSAENLAARSARIAEIEKGLAPDVAFESKGILDELKADSKGKHTTIERGANRSSVVDGREAGRTPVSKPGGAEKKGTRISVPPPPPPAPTPAPPSHRDHDLSRPSSQKPAPVITMSQDELMTSPSAVISPELLRGVRSSAPPVAKSPVSRPPTIPPMSPPQRNSSPGFSGFGDPPPPPPRRNSQPSFGDVPPPPQRRNSQPSFGDDQRPSRPLPMPPRARIASLTGAHVDDDIPELPQELASPNLSQFALPEIPPMTAPVDIQHTDYTGKAKPKNRFNFVGIFLVLGIGAFGAYLAAPYVIEKVYVGAAARRGITVKVDRVTVDPHVIKFFGVAATSDDLPGIYVHAGEIDFNIRDQNPATMTAIGVDATIDGPFVPMRDTVNRYLASHPLKDGNDQSGESLQAIVVQKGHFTWGRLAGDNTKIEAEEVAGKVDRVPGHSLGEDFVFTSQRFNVTTPFGTVGPWGANLSVGPFATRIDVALIPSSPNAAAIHYTDQSNSGVQIEGKINRTTIDALGIPRAIVGVAVDESMQLEASVHYAHSAPTVVESNVAIGIYGARLRGAVAPVDIRAQGGFAGDPTSALPINSGLILFGGFRGEIWGKTQLTKDAFRIDASWRTAPRSCGSATSVDPTVSLSTLAQDAAGLDRAVNSAAYGGQTYVAGSFVLDTHDIGQSTMTAVPSNGCKSKIFP